MEPESLPPGSPRRFLRDDRGQALVEFALIAPIQIFIVLGILQVAYLLIGRQVVAYAADAASRAHLVGRDPQRAAALVCSLIAPVEQGNGLSLPGWGTLPRSVASLDRTRMEILKDPGGHAGMIHVAVIHEFHLGVPFVNVLLADRRHPGGGYSLALRGESVNYKAWSDDPPPGARGHPWIPDVGTGARHP
jgi:Flp pilus assembly pilin Flp